MIKLRPHHLLCVSFYSGKGYSAEFIQKMDWLVASLAQADTYVDITSSKDVLCEICPNLKDDCCVTSEKSDRYDILTKKYGGIQDGVYLYNDIKKKIKESILDKGLIKKICSDCEWAYICHPADNLR
jgi:hypothetical protein